MNAKRNTAKSASAGAPPRLRVGRRRIELSHPDKIYFPDSGLTKGDVVGYYRRIADYMLPYLKDRPLAVQRFPDGIGEDGFYQKNRPPHFPDWIAEVAVETEDDVHTHVLCQDAATLVYLANQACIVFHAWLSRQDTLRRPDQLVFDLDPADDDFDSVRFAAQAIRELLRELECSGFPKTTGSRGLHVVVPIKPEADFDDVRRLAKNIAGLAARRAPERLTTETRKNARKGRLFLDYLRNGYAQHAVVPYSLRALPGAPVATPLAWSELDAGQLDARTWRLANIFERLTRRDDPWQGWRRHAVSPRVLQQRLERLG